MSIDKGWNARGYQLRHSYVFEYGESLVELLAPQPGERVLDLGCGAGQLSARIAAAGAHVIGTDLSPDMIAEARANFGPSGPRPADPLDHRRRASGDRSAGGSLEFHIADAADFELPAPVDAVFSNAVLHWIADSAGALACVYRSLKPGGRFVFEMGGKGNTRAILSAIREVAPRAVAPWFFPSISEYSTLLEAQGFEVRYATLFDRPTTVEGEDGLEDWLKMFAGRMFAGLPEEKQRDMRAEIAHKLRPAMFRDGNWVLDYRRLRMVAVKV